MDFRGAVFELSRLHHLIRASGAECRTEGLRWAPSPRRGTLEKSRRSSRSGLLLSLYLNIRAARCPDPTERTRWHFTRCFRALAGSVCGYFGRAAHVRVHLQRSPVGWRSPMTRAFGFRVVAVVSSSRCSQTEIFIKHECAEQTGGNPTQF